ncbi:hypothetical protein [Vibrio agarivorans]|uniref:hypothetical protein n=1 Tax=Vibrio agarivorans TaxID=153622 RepID=UPI00222FCFF8|nr:hypothetical protein [Vibrio agarivorans]
MSKLFKLKKFFTLDEAARHLSTALEEEVTKANIYSLALEGHLTVSVRFQGIFAMSPGRVFEDNESIASPEMIISKGMAVGESLKEPYVVSKASGYPMSRHEWLFFGREIMYAHGLWDLSMLGQEQEYIENLYHEEVGGGGAGGFNGRIQAIVLKRDDSYCKLKDIKLPFGLPEREVASFIDASPNDDFFDGLDFDSHPHQLVVKTAELTRFIQVLQDEPLITTPDEKPLATRERNTLLVLIGALCRQLDINPSSPGVASSVAAMTELVGAPVGEETVKNKLDQVAEALERRQK